jgi:hypothetical protein
MNLTRAEVSEFMLVPDAEPRPKWTHDRGVKAQRAGKSLEEIIEFSAGCQRDVVTLEHLPRMGAIMLAGRKPIISRIAIDFVGALAGGRGLFFDAKSCGKAVTGFDANQWHQERPHQAKFLRRMSKAGALAGIIVRSEERGLFLWGSIEDLDVLETVKFARDGVLCRQWTSLGETSGLVDFRKLRDSQ